MAAEPGSLSRADGSARFSQGGTEVLVSVYGPCEVKRAREQIDTATLELIVRPRAGLPSPADREFEQLMSQTLQHVVIGSLHPRSAVSIVVQVLADDGALLSTALHGSCVALMHAGVPLRGMLGGCALAVTPEGGVVLDPCAEEEATAQAVVTLAFLVRQHAGGAERRMLLSHVRGDVVSAHYDACEKAAQEAALFATQFFRQVLARQIVPLQSADLSHEALPAKADGARDGPQIPVI